MDPRSSSTPRRGVPPVPPRSLQAGSGPEKHLTGQDGTFPITETVAEGMGDSTALTGGGGRYPGGSPGGLAHRIRPDAPRGYTERRRFGPDSRLGVWPHPGPVGDHCLPRFPRRGQSPVLRTSAAAALPWVWAPSPGPEMQGGGTAPRIPSHGILRAACGDWLHCRQRKQGAQGPPRGTYGPTRPHAQFGDVGRAAGACCRDLRVWHSRLGEWGRRNPPAGDKRAAVPAFDGATRPAGSSPGHITSVSRGAPYPW